MKEEIIVTFYQRGKIMSLEQGSIMIIISNDYWRKGHDHDWSKRYDHESEVRNFIISLLWTKGLNHDWSNHDHY